MTDRYLSILQLRAIRDYRPEPLSDADLAKILEAARWTGSSKNRQDWSFLVISDRDRLQGLAEHGDFTQPVRDSAATVVLIQEPGGNMFDIGRVSSEHDARRRRHRSRLLPDHAAPRGRQPGVLGCARRPGRPLRGGLRLCGAGRQGPSTTEGARRGTPSSTATATDPTGGPEFVAHEQHYRLITCPNRSSRRVASPRDSTISPRSTPLTSTSPKGRHSVSSGPTAPARPPP